MKYLIALVIVCQSFGISFAQTNSKLADTSLLQPIELIAIRASDKTPVAKTNLSAAEIAKNNIGLDLPFLLNQTPSVTVNADAGNGIGYTGIRIRGSDASRINVSLNGIPYNDAESQGSFFVDLPDIASSANSIQVQRGVGTSANGAGAFGGSINLSTNDINRQRSLELSNSVGSYHSFKNTLSLNSGVLGKHFILSGRLSDIRSDGYIERAFSRLKSFYSSAAYINGSDSWRINIFSGKEKTYQAWNGIDEKTLALNRRYNAAGTEKPGEPYANETDNYTQTHYQLFYNHKFSDKWKSNLAFFLTRGKGYYEQYKAGESLNSYGLPDIIQGADTITSTDLVRQLWLDNYFYGSIFSFQYQQPNTQLIIGGGWNRYDGNHFGEITWTDVQNAAPTGYRWYNLDARKTDGSLFVKWTEKLTDHWQSFIDLQARAVTYRINGFRDNPNLAINNQYFFLNPKAGISYSKNKTTWYLSYARGAKEPNRDDFEAGNTQQPVAEKLNDWEAGVEQKNKRTSWAVNAFYMQYKDQLVLTGKINDVGAYTRTNIPNSYRLGIELQGAIQCNKWLSASGNISFSENKVKDFTEYIDDYDNGGQLTNIYKKTSIAFSPSVVSAISINIIPFKNSELTLMGKYVDRQYLDNTSNKTRSLDGYYVQDMRLNYNWSSSKSSTVKIFVQANNIFSNEYEANGYTFSYRYGGETTTENFYFPMAPFNMMAGISISLK